MKQLLTLVGSYAKPILIGLAIAGLLLVCRFIYGAGYDACKSEVMQATNEALINDRREAEDVRRVESRIDSNELDSALADIGILRD